MNGHTLKRMNIREPGVLVLADGSVFEGELFGAPTAAAGEIVFNTALSGYQEILTDPSYAGQIITFTNPHLGNYGVNATDFEATRLHCRGVVARDLARRPSNRRAQADLDAMLVRYGVPGITGIDTRRLTRLIRDTGAIPGAFGPADALADLLIAAREEPGTDGVDLVATVTTRAPYTVGERGFRIVAYDFGIKRTILRHLAGLGTVEVVPATTPAADVVARDPDGIFLSNGPGDPAEVAGVPEILGELLGTAIPLFGICLGNQLLGRALGGDDRQAPVRPPRRQPPRQGPHHRRRRDHQPEPQLRRGGRLARRRGRPHPRQPQRRRVRGARRPRSQRVQRPAPPRGRPRPPRQPLPVHPLRRPHGGPPGWPDSRTIR